MEREAVLVIDSTEAGKFNCTVRKSARGMPLQGALCRIDIESGAGRQGVLARIGMISTNNAVHQNPALKPLVMEDGFIQHFSRDADTETTVLDPVACVDLDTQRLAGRKANPSSGTPIYLVQNADIEMFLNEKEYFAMIGSMPGYPDVSLSMRNRHPGPVEDGGWGEARHRLYGGQTGSGKTVFALQHLLFRAVAYPQMGVLVPDTKGDIAGDLHSRGSYQFSFLEGLRRGGRAFDVISVDDIRLESTSTFTSLLGGLLKTEISTNDEKGYELARRAVQRLTDGHETIDVRQLTLEQVLQACLEEAPGAFTRATAAEKVQNLERLVANPQYVQGRWERSILPYFTGTHSTTQIAKDVLLDGRFYILNIKADDRIQDQIMRELFLRIKTRCEFQFKQHHRPVNAEIVLDEAPRWVPQTAPSEGASVIRDAVNTTRAYGLSWTFITQRLADIDKGILAQAATKWFGRNLGVGVDRQHLSNEIGDTGCALYDELSLTDSYFFVGVGCELNLGAGRAPMAIIGWDGNVTERLIEANPHIWRQSSWGF